MIISHFFRQVVLSHPDNSRLPNRLELLDGGGTAVFTAAPSAHGASSLVVATPAVSNLALIGGDFLDLPADVNSAVPANAALQAYIAYSASGMAEGNLVSENFSLFSIKICLQVSEKVLFREMKVK